VHVSLDQTDAVSDVGFGRHGPRNIQRHSALGVRQLVASKCLRKRPGVFAIKKEVIIATPLAAKWSFAKGHQAVHFTIKEGGVASWRGIGHEHLRVRVVSRAGIVWRYDVHSLRAQGRQDSIEIGGPGSMLR